KMNSLPTLLLLLTITSVLSANHNLVQKSVGRANRECYQYLRGSPECGARCQQIVLRAWDDNTGLDAVPYGRHFQPDCRDQQYENRTEQCIECQRGPSPREDHCRRSAIAFGCYRDQYGELLKSPQVVPMPDLLLRSTVEQCAQILQISDRQIADANLHLTPAGHRLMRCVIIREGFYSDADGPNLDRLYVQCGGYQRGEAAFKQHFQTCHKRILTQKPNAPTLASKLATECIPRASPNQRDVVPSRNPTIELPAGTSPASCRATQMVVCVSSCNNFAIARQCSSSSIVGPIQLSIVLASFPRENGFPITGPLIQTLPAEARSCIVDQFRYCRSNCLPEAIDRNCHAAEDGN
ncbi:hypothetical protein pipiens_017537, partial [Culex pipiens pipiens]